MSMPVLSAAEFGDIATWASSIVSAAALVAAILAGRYTIKAYRAQIERDERDNKERVEREHLRLREQAALVSAWIEYQPAGEDGEAPVIGARVRNGSQTPVYQARLTILTIHNADQTVEHLEPVIPPDAQSRFYSYGQGDPQRIARDVLAFRTELAFTDSSGVRWSRDMQGRLVQLDDKLRVWADGLRTDVLVPFAGRFSEPLGIKVEPREISIGDIQPELLAIAGGGQAIPVPDLVVGVHDWIGNLVREGVLDPVPLSTQRRQSFQPLAISAVTYQGVGYGIPYAMENVALFRNLDLVSEAPATFEELVEVGLGLRQRGRVSIVLSVPIGPSGDAYHLHPVFTAAGGPPLPIGADPGERDPSVPADLGFSSAASIEAFNRLAELGERGRQVLARTASTGAKSALSEIGVFARGLAPFLVAGPWSLAEINRSGVRYAISPIPAFSGLGPARVLVGVAVLLVPRAGQNRQMAHDFLLNYLTRTDLALALYEAEARPPALNLAIERLGPDSTVAAFAAAAADGVLMPSWPESAELFGLIGRAQANVIGGAPVEETVASLSREVADLMSRGNRVPRPRTAGSDRSQPA